MWKSFPSQTARAENSEVAWGHEARAFYRYPAG